MHKSTHWAVYTTHLAASVAPGECRASADAAGDLRHWWRQRDTSRLKGKGRCVMRTLVVYESMYGNTHTIAKRVAQGLGPADQSRVISVHDANAELVAWADLIVVGGPTHVRGLTSSLSRTSAVEAVTKPGSDLQLDPDAEGEGLREWFDGLADVAGKGAAAFDTRLDSSPILTGRASRGISRRLTSHGFTLVCEPESFLVDKQTHLVEGEADRAEVWGRQLIELASANSGLAAHAGRHEQTGRES